jgi:hypothetical protein
MEVGGEGPHDEPMNRPSHDPDGLDIDVDAARRIDLVVFRRFEVDWRAGKAVAIGDYLRHAAEEGRPALQAELVNWGRYPAQQYVRSGWRVVAWRPDPPEDNPAPVGRAISRPCAEFATSFTMNFYAWKRRWFTTPARSAFSRRCGIAHRARRS